MEVGLHPEMSWAEYESLDAANKSMLVQFKFSAAHARQYMVAPADPTPALAIGQALHCCALEPSEFEKLYVAAPSDDRRTKAWKDFRDAHRDREILRKSDHKLCVDVRDALWSHPTAARILQGAGRNEVSFVWEDEATGEFCKGRLDRLTQLGDWTVIADLKSCRDASAEGFSRAVATYDWHVQAAFYTDGLNAIEPRERRFLFVAFEKTPPYAVAVYELDRVALEQGRDEYRRYLRLYKNARETGIWPGYPEGVQSLTLPRWAVRFAEGEIEV